MLSLERQTQYATAGGAVAIRVETEDEESAVQSKPHQKNVHYAVSHNKKFRSCHTTEKKRAEAELTANHINPVIYRDDNPLRWWKWNNTHFNWTCF